MKHFSYDEWLKYVKDEINHHDREEFESHLYTCDLCLEHYLQAVAEHESSLPTVSDESSFTDLVMAEVTKLKASEEKPVVAKQTDMIGKPAVAKQTTAVKKPFYQQALFHYLLAAAATLLLTFSGVFQSLGSVVSAIEPPQNNKEIKPSMTEGVIDKTFAWMDSLEKKEANKK